MTSEALQRSANWVVAFGVALILIGSLAILAPLATGIAIETMVGAIFILGGIAELVYAIRAAAFGAGPLAGVSGLLSLVCGILMVLHPILGLKFLTLLLAGYFLVDGIVRLVLASRLRDLPGSGWMLFDGIVTLALAVLIFAEWPVSGTWAIGLLVGINLLLTGWAILAAGLAAKRFVDLS
ncbi:MAG TPA: HdeD family acid-resistance protein [Pirellulales bacterium]|jgi:uncharacterized membrane protein HdeD (DUF308 family)|nr:HdeD family acid-resistance protein [Pirellulales bacterium]